MLNSKQEKGRTLQQSLLWFIAGLLVLLLMGSFILNITVTRDYLEKQLQSHAQDTATSLGLSLSASIDARDKVAASRMIDAIFDSGDYRSIVLFGLDGAAIVIRQQSLSVEHIPDWFISLIKLSAPAKSAQVVSGWSQLGTVVVESHPGYAYIELWRMIQTQSLWFAIIAFASFILAHLMLGGILKPLKNLEAHAHAMSQRRFEVRASYPKSRELAGVARAMNDMAGQLGKMFQEQLEQIEGLRSQSFIDKLTGLSNREGFDGRLKTELDSQQHTAQGSLILLQLNNFGSVNESLGREGGDALLVSVGALFSKLIVDNQGSFGARRSAADFSIFLPRIMAEDIDSLAHQLIADLNSLPEIKHLLRDDSLHMGVACVREGDIGRVLFSKADMALRQAQGKGVSGWQRYANIEAAAEAVKEVRQANEWRTVLQGVLAERSVKIYTQSVFDSDKSFLYYQVLSRIELDEEVVVAGLFLPMAERFQLMVPFDELVVEKVIEALSSGHEADSAERLYCVTLSEDALIDMRFMAWFEEQMSQNPLVASRLMIEVTEHIVSYNEAALQNLSQLAEKYGFKISIERFGVSSVPFSYLQRVQINYIKVDHSFIRHIQGNQSNQFFLRSAVQIAHGQSVQIIAVGVESEEEWDTLTSLGLDGAMGYYLGRPKPGKIFDA